MCWSACTPSCDHHLGNGSLGTQPLVSCSLWHGALCLHSWNNLRHSLFGWHLCPSRLGPCFPRTCSCFCIGSCLWWSLDSLLQSWLFIFPWGNLLGPLPTSLLARFWKSCQAWYSILATWPHVSCWPLLEGIGPSTSQWSHRWGAFLVWAHRAPSLPNPSCWLYGTTLLHRRPILVMCRVLVPLA